MAQFPGAVTHRLAQARSSVDAYRDGYQDGERGSKHNHFIGGVSVGLILAGVIMLVVLITGIAS